MRLYSLRTPRHSPHVRMQSAFLTSVPQIPVCQDADAANVQPAAAWATPLHILQNA